MNIWLVAVVVIAVVGLLPAIYRAAAGTAAQRLLGLQFVSVAGLMMIIALSMTAGQSSYLIVAVVLALLSAAGLLVFTRLLAPESRVGTNDRSEGDDG